MIGPVVSTAAEAAARYGAVPREVVPGATLTTIAGARVLAQPVTVVGPDDALLWGFAPQLKRTPESAAFLGRTPETRVRPLPGRALLAAVDGFSFYHWMTGTLPKLLLAQRAGLEPDWYVVNPRHKGPENFQTESLRRLGIPLAKVAWIERGSHFACDELTLPSEPCAEEQHELAPWALAMLHEMLAPGREAHAEQPRRILVSRARARRRRLVNEDELHAALAPRGFVRVELEAMPLQAQAEMLAGADVVVGLHGAGLVNLAFARRGTRLVEILPDAWQNPCFQRLAALIGASYASVGATATGDRDGFAADACVDVAAVVSAVDRLS